jgi:cytoskeletal protein CcmA (bactofilin family)
MKHTLSFFVAALFLAPLLAGAATVSTDKTVSIPQTQLVADNAYLAGGDVIFSSTAQKDLVAAGGTVTVSGQVWGEEILAGGDIEILNEVRGSVRAAGGTIRIQGPVRGDVLAGGGDVTLLPGSVVGGDVIILGGKVDIEGSVNGEVRVYGGEVTINGTVLGPVLVRAGKSLTFGEKTVLGGTLTYTAPQEASVAEGAKLPANIAFTQSEGHENAPGIKGIILGVVAFLVVAKLIAILAAALIFVYFFAPFVKTLTDRTVLHFWKKVGVGFIALIVTPIAAILAMITVIGIYVGLFFLLSYLVVLVLAGVYMGVLAGGILSKWIVKEVRTDWKWTILGTLAVFLLGLIPIVGWIVDFFLFLAALGAITLSVHRDAKEKMA